MTKFVSTNSLNISIPVSTLQVHTRVDPLVRMPIVQYNVGFNYPSIMLGNINPYACHSSCSSQVWHYCTCGPIDSVPTVLHKKGGSWPCFLIKVYNSWSHIPIFGKCCHYSCFYLRWSQCPSIGYSWIYCIGYFTVGKFT